ncbi:prolyl-tRNA synthetase associated domain-containing protein [Granulosicoccus sp.]|nr:prolyl-tRNA synthetase associated domain-containing protein [Granulosicoccus sp.]MDB4222170.1 prolyl-tRNA synthetase associated domain-containing protein [Granulosicoccus sp.]
MSHSDRPNPETIVLENGALAATADDVLALLDSLGMEHKTVIHEPLYTVEEAKTVTYDSPGAHTKNLFLRNKKGKMFLLVVEQNHRVDLRGLRDRLKIAGGQFAFASTERLSKFLGVVPGSVSPLALINDHGGAVQVYFQHSILNQEWIYLHPCRNTHSTRLKTADLLKLLDYWNHPITQINFDSE